MPWASSSRRATSSSSTDVLPLLATPLVGVVEVGERTETRVRGSSLGVQTDAEAGFRFRLGLHGRRVELALSVAPRVTAFSWADSQRAVLASTPGQIAIGYRERHYGIFLSGDGSYGLENYATLRYPTAAVLPGAPPGQPVPPQTLPTLPGADTIAYVGARGARAAYQVPTARWVVTEAAAFEASGGATTTSRGFVPFQYGPRLALSLDHRVTRQDHLGASADAQVSRFSTGADVGLATVVVRYARDVARGTTLSIGGGASGAAFRTEPNPFRLVPFGVGEISVAHHRGFLGHRLDLDGAVRFAPTVDRIAAVVDPRISAAINAIYTTRAVIVRVSGSFAQSVLADSTARITAFGTEATVRVPITRAVGLEGGPRLAIQSFQGTIFNSFAFFLALDLHPDMLHFRTP